MKFCGVLTQIRRRPRRDKDGLASATLSGCMCAARLKDAIG